MEVRNDQPEVILTKEEMDEYVKTLFKAIKDENYDQLMNIFMVESIVSIRVVNKNKETVFMAAAAHGNVQIFNMLTDLTELLQLRAQEMGKMRKGNLLDDLLRQRDKNGRTVLFHCLDCNSISVLKMLIHLNVDLNAQDIDGNTCLHLASKRTGSIDFIRTLVKNGASCKIKNKSGFLPIDLAIMASNFSFNKNKAEEYNDIIKIMKTGAIALKDDDKSDDEEDEMSQKESSKLFQIDLKGQNVFHKYAWEGDLKEMQNTVSHVQKIKSESFCKKMLNARDHCGCTPLHNAIIRNHRGVMLYLINQGADINVQDNIGFTPLMEAVAQNNKYAIDILLKNSADLELKDHRDRSARNIADEFKCKFFQDKTSNRRTILNNL